MGWEIIGRPGPFGSRKEIIINNYNTIYGEGNWNINWNHLGEPLELNEVVKIYEEAYFQYFKEHPDELKWIAENYENVYDNNPSNVNSGLDYTKQEFGGNHYQDIAIRNCLDRNKIKFSGKGLLEIRMSEPGIKWNPGKIPFHIPEAIIQPEFPIYWVEEGSIESWYQAIKFLEVKERLSDADIYFVTSNDAKFASAKLKAPKELNITQLRADIPEPFDNIETIAIHKAYTAYAITCSPVVCDDSGFFIPSENNYPGHLVGRELKEHGIKHFHEIAKKHGGSVSAYFQMVVAYFDGTTPKPILYKSTKKGTLIDELRGDLNNKPYVKSAIFGSFILDGQTKTLAEMDKKSFITHASSDRWNKLYKDLTTNKL